MDNNTILVKHFTIKEAITELITQLNEQLHKLNKNFYYGFDIEVEAIKVGSGILDLKTIGPQGHQCVFRLWKRNKHNSNKEDIFLTYSAPIILKSAIEGMTQQDVATAELILLRKVLGEALTTFLITAEQVLKAKTADHAKG